MREREHPADAGEHGEPADGDREQRGDEGPEHPQEHEQRERKRDQLGGEQVVLEQPVQGREVGRLAGGEHLERSGPERGAYGRVGANRVLLVALQPDEDEDVVAGAGEEPGLGPRQLAERGDHLGDLGQSADLGDGAGERLAEPRVVVAPI